MYRVEPKYDLVLLYLSFVRDTLLLASRHGEGARYGGHAANVVLFLFFSVT